MSIKKIFPLAELPNFNLLVSGRWGSFFVFGDPDRKTISAKTMEIMKILV